MDKSYLDFVERMGSFSMDPPEEQKKTIKHSAIKEKKDLGKKFIFSNLNDEVPDV